MAKNVLISSNLIAKISGFGPDDASEKDKVY